MDVAPRSTLPGSGAAGGSAEREQREYDVCNSVRHHAYGRSKNRALVPPQYEGLYAVQPMPECPRARTPPTANVTYHGMTALDLQAPSMGCGTVEIGAGAGTRTRKPEGGGF